jgi:hypothetical protein
MRAQSLIKLHGVAIERMQLSYYSKLCTHTYSAPVLAGKQETDSCCCSGLSDTSFDARVVMPADCCCFQRCDRPGYLHPRRFLVRTSQRFHCPHASARGSVNTDQQTSSTNEYNTSESLHQLLQT